MHCRARDIPRAEPDRAPDLVDAVRRIAVERLEVAKAAQDERGVRIELMRAPEVLQSRRKALVVALVYPADGPGAVVQRIGFDGAGSGRQSFRAGPLDIDRPTILQVLPERPAQRRPGGRAQRIERQRPPGGLDRGVAQGTVGLAMALARFGQRAHGELMSSEIAGSQAHVA